MKSLRIQLRTLRNSLRSAVHTWRAKRIEERRSRLTRRLIADGGTDTARWSSPSNFERYWVERNRMIAASVPPGLSVIEFGAGLRELEKLLPAACRYTPSDLVDRGPGTIVCNLNIRPLPSFPKHDIAVLSGVLEYLHNPGDVLKHLHGSAPLLLMSYSVWDGTPATLERRRADGFVNDLHASSLRSLLHDSGWDHEVFGEWQGQQLLRCRSRQA